MLKQLLNEYRLASVTHAVLYEKLIKLRDTAASLSQEDLVDCAYILRETAKLLDDMRKESTAIRELIERVICLKWVQQSLQDESTDTAIRGQLATGTPDVRQMASLPLPNKNPEEFEALMRSIGAVTAAKKDLVRPYWPGLTNWITNLVKKGKPLPNGIDPNKTYALYRLFPLRRKKGLILETVEIVEKLKDGKTKS